MTDPYQAVDDMVKASRAPESRAVSYRDASYDVDREASDHKAQPRRNAEAVARAREQALDDELTEESTPAPAVQPTRRIVPSFSTVQRASSASEPVQRAAAIDPVQALIAVLATCESDEQRAALLNATPQTVLEQFHAHCGYHAFVDDADRELTALADLTAKLEDAPDDAARSEILASTDPQLLAEWARSRAMTEADSRREYLDLI